MTDINDYDVGVREIDTEYGPLLARDVGREVEGSELRLKSVTVTLCIKWDRNGEQYRDYLDVVYSVDHDSHTVTQRSVGPQSGEVERISAGKLAVAFTVGDRTVHRLLDDLDVDLDVIGWTDQLQTAVHERDDDVAVHTEGS